MQENETFEDRFKALRYSWAGKKRESGELQFETLQRPPGAGKGPNGRQWQKFNMLKAMESALEWPQETVFKVHISQASTPCSSANCITDLW